MTGKKSTRKTDSAARRLSTSPEGGAGGCPMLDESDKKIRWAASWISPPGDKAPNYYFLARKNFKIAAVPRKALLRIAADARYAVYVNGEFVGNGPARGTHKRYFADSYSVASLLHPGSNWIAAEVHCCLKPTYTMAPFHPALLAELPGMVATDATWQVRVDPSHRADALTYTGQIGFSEWKEIPAEPPGWMTGGDGPSAWVKPLVMGEPDVFTGRRVVPRPIAPPDNSLLHPAKIIETGRVPFTPGAAENPDYATLIATEPHAALPLPAAPLMTAMKPLLFEPGPGREGAYAIIDFGREVFGNIQVDIEAPAKTILEAAHSDGIFDGRVHSLMGRYRFADRFQLRAGRQTVGQRLHQRGFRFLQIALRDFSAPVKLHGVTLVSRSYSRPALAEFSCPDKYLNRLWAMCANTVRACSADTFMDCPWREQALWTNDQAATSLYYLAMTGDPVFAAHNLRIGADGARPDGLIPPVYPSQAQRPFPVLPALWTFTLSDYYNYTGDRKTLRELLPVMERALAIYESWRDADGLVADQEGMWNFVDWGYRGGQPHPAPGGKTAVLNTLIAAAYKRAALLEEIFKNNGLAAEYANLSRRTVAALNAVLWDQSRGRFHDCTAYAEGVAPSSSQHPLAIGLYHDLFAGPQRDAALASLTSPELIKAEFYFQHYVLLALARHGRVMEALDIIRAMWRDNVEEDCDTAWEMHTAHKAVPEAMPSHSRCHGFSCAPLYFLQSVILGVQPTQPGFAEFTLAPRPGDLAHARGAVPAPRGLIRVEWHRTERDSLQISAEIPSGARAVTPSGKTLGHGNHELEEPVLDRNTPPADA